MKLTRAIRDPARRDHVVEDPAILSNVHVCIRFGSIASGKFIAISGLSAFAHSCDTLMTSGEGEVQAMLILAVTKTGRRAALFDPRVPDRIALRGDN